MRSRINQCVTNQSYKRIMEVDNLLFFAKKNNESTYIHCYVIAIIRLLLSKPIPIKLTDILLTLIRCCVCNKYQDFSCHQKVKLITEKSLYACDFKIYWFLGLTSDLIWFLILVNKKNFLYVKVIKTNIWSQNGFRPDRMLEIIMSYPIWRSHQQNY